MAKKKIKDKIRVLSAQEAIRLRPDMYIDDTSSSAVTHLVREVIDNSVDEIINKNGSTAIIELFVKDNMIRIMDNGSGIPYQPSIEDPQHKSLLNINISTPHAGGKFDDDVDSEDKLYKYSSGLHGLGLTILASLSTYFKISSIVNNKAYNIFTSIGNDNDLVINHETKNFKLESFDDVKASTMYTDTSSPFFSNGKRITSYNKLTKKKTTNGTLVEFIPDKRIFESGNDIFNELDIKDMLMKKHIGSNADLHLYIYKSTKSKKADEVLHLVNTDKKVSLIERHFQYVCKGINDYSYNNKKPEDHKNLTFPISKPFSLDKDFHHRTPNGNTISGNIKFFINWGYMIDGKKEFDSFFSYEDQYHKPNMMWANTIYINEPDEDAVMKGILSGALLAIKEYAKNCDMNKNTIINITKKAFTKHIKQTLICFVDYKASSISFKGQTKQAVTNEFITDIVKDYTYKAFLEFLYTEKKKAKLLMSLIEQFVIGKATTRTFSIKVDSTLPPKLADCMSEHRKDRGILFILEGDSATGAAKKARDNSIHALLPIRGKILNVMKVPANKISSTMSLSVEDIIKSLGGSNTLGKNYDLRKMRYSALAILVDEDVDGSHIASLLLLLCYLCYPTMIKAGRLYRAVSPLFKVTSGKQIEYAYSIEDMKSKVLKITNSGRKYEVKRFKGIGEMNPADLSNTTFSGNPENLVPITWPNGKTDEEIHNICVDIMGVDTSFRKSLLDIFNTKDDNISDDELITLIHNSDFSF